MQCCHSSYPVRVYGLLCHLTSPLSSDNHHFFEIDWQISVFGLNVDWYWRPLIVTQCHDRGESQLIVSFCHFYLFFYLECQCNTQKLVFIHNIVGKESNTFYSLFTYTYHFWRPLRFWKMHEIFYWTELKISKLYAGNEVSHWLVYLLLHYSDRISILGAIAKMLF